MKKQRVRGSQELVRSFRKGMTPKQLYRLCRYQSRDLLSGRGFKIGRDQ